MKPVFGFDVTDDKYSEKSYCSLFLQKELSKETSDELDRSRQTLENTVSDSKLPFLLRIIMYVTGIFALIVISGILEADVGVAQAIRNAPVLCILGFLAGIAWAVIFTAGVIKKRHILNSRDVDGTLETLEALVEKAYCELEVPGDAKKVDVLLFRYYMTDDGMNMKVKGSATSVSPFINHEMRAYIEGGNLCLADVEAVYRFPIDSFQRISTVKKRIIIGQWHKEERHNKGEYKQYKISTNQYGYSLKNYHALELERFGETYGIYFPAYELHVFESLTHLSAENPIDKAETK